MLFCFNLISYQEGRISKSLITNGIMYRQPCRDTENKKEQFTYRVGKKHSHMKIEKCVTPLTYFHSLVNCRYSVLKVGIGDRRATVVYLQKHSIYGDDFFVARFDLNFFIF